MMRTSLKVNLNAIVFTILATSLFLIACFRASALVSDSIFIKSIEKSGSSQDISTSLISINGKCEDVYESPPLLACCGHRGARLIAPENTLASFHKALETGANCIEMDIHRTSDGLLAVVHGRTLRQRLLSNENPNSSRLIRHVESMEWNELHRLDAGSWMDSQFSSERIPLLREVTESLWLTPVQLILELKIEKHHCGEADLSSFGISPGVAHADVEEGVLGPMGECMSVEIWEKLYVSSLVEWLSAAVPAGMQGKNPRFVLILSSFQHTLLDKIEKEFAKKSRLVGPLASRVAGLAYIYGQDRPINNHSFPSIPSPWIAPHYSMVDALNPSLKESHRVISWVVDDLDSMKKQKENGVQAIITNDPSLCQQLCIQ